MKEGFISQIIGPVVDVHFPEAEGTRQLPAIDEALSIRRENGTELVVEVQQHIGEQAARTVAMQTASDNAAELLDDLSLTYNKRRQQAITDELADITPND